MIGVQCHVSYPHLGNNPTTTLVQILKELKEIKFDKGSKNFQATNLEVTKININNTADNVIPDTAKATFNIRFNNKHSSNSIKKIAPCLEFGLVGKTMHKIDEAVLLSDLKKLTLIYSNILKTYFK